MPSTPLTSCSIGEATVSERTLASAPGYVVVTWTVGGGIWGYCSIGRTKTVTAPMSMVMIARTLAKIGRSMKKREIMVRFAGLRGQGVFAGSALASTTGVGPSAATARAGWSRRVGLTLEPGRAF